MIHTRCAPAREADGTHDLSFLVCAVAFVFLYSGKLSCLAAKVKSRFNSVHVGLYVNAGFLNATSATIAVAGATNLRFEGREAQIRFASFVFSVVFFITMCTIAHSTASVS